jgi:enoyl-CoA hydratase
MPTTARVARIHEYAPPEVLRFEDIVVGVYTTRPEAEAGGLMSYGREAGWANAMRYILTGDHWTAAEAYRMGTAQEVLPTPDAAIQRAIELAGRIADCGPLGIKTSLASAHLAVDPVEAAALARLDAQFGALFHSRDFQEGRDAEAEGRRPVYQGR